ncbi:hypothetical protein CDD81_5414 [Ophiocordyceps australis]|uniref:Phytanoyl-CoA dioxygenase n=1 Tax=Ophiocordyceps australis TaxID=1399860 RepID=A0A2C5Y585_9HYPO|nr:hypothetical protein CDD81_5414 [Ophiocordyceps australis]
MAMLPRIAIPASVTQGGICPPPLMAEALGHLHRSGIVVLTNAIDTQHIDVLNATVSDQAATFARDPGQHFNFGVATGNINQGPPLDRELLFHDVWMNPIVMSIVSAFLGPRPVLHYACGNTALPAAADGRQPVHSDIDFAHPQFPFSVVINIPLVDMNEANGATEVWLGSHIDTSLADQALPTRRIVPELVERRRLICPPTRCCAPRASIIIRDLRLWHAGQPNLTLKPRPMLAFVWSAAWWRGKGAIHLPLDVKPIVRAWEANMAVPIQVAARWVDGPFDQRLNSIPNAEDTSLSSSDDALLAMLSTQQPSWH